MNSFVFHNRLVYRLVHMQGYKMQQVPELAGILPNLDAHYSKNRDMQEHTLDHNLLRTNVVMVLGVQRPLVVHLSRKNMN